jgi:hypothetical protein
MDFSPPLCFEEIALTMFLKKEWSLPFLVFFIFTSSMFDFNNCPFELPAFYCLGAVTGGSLFLSGVNIRFSYFWFVVKAVSPKPCRHPAHTLHVYNTNMLRVGWR